MPTDSVDGVALYETEEELESALSLISKEISEATGGRETISRKIAAKVAVDPSFAGRLIAKRGSPEGFKEIALQSERQGTPKWAPAMTARLALDVARGLARWAAHGFGEVAEDVLEKRRAACLACPNLTEPGDHLFVRKTLGWTTEVCSLCSCAVEKKIRLPTETCPESDPDNPGLNRWGEDCR